MRPISTPPASVPAQPAVAKANHGKLEMDWDDDNEATHVYDKEKSNAEASAEILRGPDLKEPERASMDAIMAEPPRTSSQIPAAPRASGAPSPGDAASLSGAFGALGQQPGTDRLGSAPPPRKAHSVPPPPARSAPPPPPPSRTSGSLTSPPAAATPPPPPPGQVTTAPMHMPATQRPASVPPRSAATGSTPPPSSAPPSYGSSPSSVRPSTAPTPQLPPVSRAMEQTLLTRSPTSRASVMGALMLTVMGIVAAAVFFLMPRTGTLVVNVADSKGVAVNHLEVLIDGTKRCDSAPCIVREMPAGVHEVRIVARGYEPPAPRAVTVDSRRDATTDFQLVASKTAAGTGFKVAAASPGVRLQVDGKDVGPLPQELRDLAAGDHKLRFVGDRYAPLEKTITVAKDEIVDLGTVSLKVVKGKATIQLGSPGAKVYLVSGSNRKEVPQLPMAIEFDSSEKWELQATKDGFEDFKERISFEDGQAEKTFTITLSPKGSPAAAPQSAGVAAAAPPAGPSAALAKEPAPPTPKAAAAPAAPQPEKKDAPASAAGGEAVLKINSLPASSIVLDGKPIGVTPQVHVPVAPGTHTIMFVNAEQSLKKTISVEVKAGETKAAFAKLRD